MTSGQSSNEGRLLDGRYRLGSLLGVGGVAEVYRAIDERLHRGVAVKLFRGDVADQLHRHEDEMRTLARLNHPSLVTVFDAGTDEVTQQPYLVMALVEGSTLADQLRVGAISPQRTAEIGASVADALAYVHGQGLVHRDIKPANVLISNAGRVFLADFGIARLVDSAHVTQAGDVLGTPSFFSPEQVSGEPVGPPTDVYALGLVLLECLTGKREYDGSSLEVAMARLNRQPNIPPILPPAWRDVLTGMTARQAASRLSAAQVADRLRRIADGDDRTVVMGGGAAVTDATIAMQPVTQVMPPAPPPPPTVAVPVGAATPPGRGRGARVAAWLLALVIIAAAGVAAAVIANHHDNSGDSSDCTPGTPSLKPALERDMESLEALVCKPAGGTLSKKASKSLLPLAEGVRVAANGSSRAAVRSAVVRLRSEVTTLEQGSGLSEQRANDIEDAALALQTLFLARHEPTAPPTTEPPTTESPSITPTPTITTTTTITAPPPPPSPPTDSGSASSTATSTP